MSSLYNPDFLLHLCKKYGLEPSKQYGQNYLIDPAVIEAIMAVADLKTTDIVVEVGPGFGVLTLALVEKAQRVVSFEIEKKLEPYWVKMIEDRRLGNLEIEWGNVLREFDRFCHSEPQRGEESLSQSQNGQRSFASLRMTTPYKVVANLPYQITSPVIRLFLEAEHPPESMILMVQKEVAERICAKPGDMSLLSVAVQYYATAELMLTVPRTAFWPSPRVDSAVIKIVNKKKGPVIKEFDERFFSIVKAGFAQRRKLLIKNILPTVGKKHNADLKKVFSDLGLLPTARAQELSVEQWVSLVCHLEL